MLINFFYGDKIPQDETLMKMKALLQLYAADSSELISRYFWERHLEQVGVPFSILQICQKSRRLGCVIPHCNLQHICISLGIPPITQVTGRLRAPHAAPICRPVAERTVYIRECRIFTPPG